VSGDLSHLKLLVSKVSSDKTASPAQTHRFVRSLHHSRLYVGRRIAAEIRKPDVVIAGAGGAGCALAARLTEDPACDVLLLEAGPDLRAAMPGDIRNGWRPTRSFDWGYASEPDDHGAVRDLPRGRLLGGCSSTNATCALRGAPADYDAWGEVNPGWSFEDVLPHFIGLENDADFGDRPWHGEAGPIPIRRYGDDELTDVAAATLTAFDAAGIPAVDDHNAPGAVGGGRLPVNCRDEVRMSTALTYLPAAEERANLEVRSDTEVAEVAMDGARATGVRLIDGTLLEAGAVALCAGAYGSPTLLLRSGIGPVAHLTDLGIPVRVDLPGIGSNLADHPSVSLKMPYIADPGPAPLFQVVATLRSEGAEQAGPPDLQLLVFGPYPAEEGSPPLFYSAAALLKPHSRGTVELRSAAPTDAPRIQLGYLSEEADVERLLEGLERAEAIAAHPAMRSLCAPGNADDNGPPTAPEERREWVRRNCWTYHHPVGTCAMGPAPERGAVVDRRGRVHGTEGLFVADASVMPDIPSANTLIPTLMVAERFAELISAQLR
jgi:choline dehydrogenase